MLKIVVFDSGYGGEFFADRLEAALPVVEVIRVIAWRHAEVFLKNPRKARELTRDALRPYIGKVDLIVFANHLLSATSLKYFKRKYRTQKFVGLKIKQPDTFVKRRTIILTTKALTRTINYYNYVLHLKRKHHTFTLDDWPAKIDDGTLTRKEIAETIKARTAPPEEVILACSQFEDIKKDLRRIYGHNLRIHDSFDGALHDINKALRIRGGLVKKK